MYFLGPGWNWNIADFLFVILACVDFLLGLAVSTEDSNLQLFTIMRLVRLLRLARIVRLLRFKAFKELVLMIRGVLAGLRTLFWAIMLLCFVIYCLGMVLRETMGQWCDPTRTSRTDGMCSSAHLVQHGPRLFSTVWKSCFTMFRCFTDGCTSADGTPLMVHIEEDGAYGIVIVVLYQLCFLIVTFGLFNLIMAIFVETTLDAAKADERKRQHLRHRVHIGMAKKLHTLVLHFCRREAGVRVARGASADSLLSEPSTLGRVWQFFVALRYGLPEDDDDECLKHAADVIITRDLFGSVVEEPAVLKLLEELEVHVSNPEALFDALDADCSGALDVTELVQGILRLRGSAEKSDLVASLLGVRAVQARLQAFEERTVAAHKRLEALLEKRATGPTVPASGGRPTAALRSQGVPPRSGPLRESL